jgi:DNA-binding XRE family transcriptional regulator
MAMPRHVLLSTDQPGFASAWERALAAHGLAVVRCAPDELAERAASSAAVIIDAGSRAYDEDELLTAAGHVRATGAVLVVHVAPRGPLAAVDDVVHELAFGLIARSDADIVHIAASIARRVDRGRARRFEFVTLAAHERALLAIIGDGRALLLPRPVAENDDGGEIVSITLTDDAAAATLALASGLTITLRAADVVPTELPSQSTMASLPIDGMRLGNRLRELRREAGLTQAELARRTGIHRPNIARVEAGRHTPSLETLARLASAIGVATTRVLSED